MYLKEIKLQVDGAEAGLYVTDDAETAWELRREGKAVLIYLHPGNADRDFSGFLYAVEDPEELEDGYVDRVYRRLAGLPWNILATDRCLVRETTPGDVDAFYEIYSHPAITEYMEGLYPEIEQERQYVREYIERVYTFFGFGVWTVVERESGAVIGRAGISYREGFEDPELGFIIGVPWQGRGYAGEVCRAILAYAREELGFKQIQALVETQNRVSLALCEKLGFWRQATVVMKNKEYYHLVYRHEA